MRLSTLARKIDKTPTQLIKFLEGKGVELENGLHSKLDSETVDLVMGTFLPEEQIVEERIEEKEIDEDKIVNEQVDEEKVDVDQIEDKEVEKEQIETVKKEEEKIEVEETVEKMEEKPIIVKAEKPEAEKPKVEKPEVEKPEVEEPIAQETIIEPKTGTLEDLENENSDEIELIKAKKVKLDGIKVVGKIELPEKPKTETPELKAEAAEAKTVEKPKKHQKSQPSRQAGMNRSFDRNRKKSPKGRSRTPLSYDEKLKREDREKLRKRRQIEKAEKKRKKKYYEKNLQQINTPKPKKRKQQPPDTVSKQKVSVHKNPLKRLWSWLNGDYDRY